MLSNLIDERRFDAVFIQKLTNSKTLPQESAKSYNVFNSAVHGNRKRLAIVIPREAIIIASGRCAYGVIVVTPTCVYINVHFPSNATDEDYNHAVMVAREMILTYVPSGNPGKKRIIFG